MSLASLTKIWHRCASKEHLPEVSREVAVACTNKENFCLWLRGELGAGKTAFAQAFLHELGLDARVPVLSPTFTYMTEYQVQDKSVFHMDLYRLPDGDEDSLVMLLEGRRPWGRIIEWPERCQESLLIAPSHVLDILIEDSEARRYTLSSAQISFGA